MSPPQKEQRPEDAAPERHSEDSAAAKPLELFDVDSRAGRASVATQLRGRRQASLRCQPLTDGRRDTLGGRRRPEVGKHLAVEVGKRTVWLYDGTRGDRVFALLEAAQVEQRQWDWQRRCWMVSVNRADDVLAFAEFSDRWTVAVEAVDR